MITDVYEQKVLFWLQEMLLKQDPQIGSGDQRITVDEVYLVPGGTENTAVIVFREKRRPQCQFGSRFPLYQGFVQGATEEQQTQWSDSERNGPQVDADVIVHGHLRELIEAADMGLPENCAENSITWV